MEKRKIIIDCDPGIDDSLAIMLALQSPELEVLGITIVCGNSPVEMGFENAKKVLQQMGRLDIPIYIGAEKPIQRDYVNALDTHGADGLGGPCHRSPLSIVASASRRTSFSSRVPTVSLIQSSSPGVALMQEGISYMAGAEIPGVVVNVQRGGPGLGTIQPSQSDYFQATRGGGNGDYYVIVLAPNSVQEMADFVDLAFELAFKYRNPAMILSDGVIGQMMEKVVLPPIKPRRTEEQILKECPWATTGRTPDREPNILTSLELKPEVMEVRNLHLQEKYREIEENEVRYETIMTDDADYIVVSFGSAARIAEKAIEVARQQGIKAGLFRPITLWPFPKKQLCSVVNGKKGVLVAEINAGQMVEDVRLALNGTVKVEHYGRLGGIVPEPEEMVNAIKEKLL